MRHVRLLPTLVLTASAALGGCTWHDHSKDVASRCVRETGSHLCSNPDETNVVSGSDPAIQMHSPMPHD